MNTPFYPVRKIFCGVFLFSIFTATQSVDAQNSYPMSGDALIHGLTIGTGPGTYNYQNTALGATALPANTGGGFNVAVGVSTLHSNTQGSTNVAVGYTALYSNIGPSASDANGGSGNIAIGHRSLYANTYGESNVSIGTLSLPNNTTGSYNTACGTASLEYNTTGYNNVGIGTYAMSFNSTGSNNTALGYDCFGSNTTGYSNVVIGGFTDYFATNANNLVVVGDSALYHNTASFNVAIGSQSLYSNSSGTDNTALGYQSLYSNTTGGNNTASGYGALWSDQTGSDNAAFGTFALFSNTGANNTATGTYTLYYNTSGSGNTGYGLEAMLNNTTGSFNTGIGELAGPASGNLTNTTAIGYDAATSASNSVVIGNSSVTSIGGYAGWTNFSDGRFKKNIKQNVPGLAFINQLNPITYTLDIDGIETMRQKFASGGKRPDGAAGPTADPVMTQAQKEKAQVVYTGFVAQDVDKAAQSLGYNFSGVDKPKNDQQSFYGLRYSDFVVPLVKAVQELSAQNDSLQQANAQLSRRLDQVEQILGITKPGNSSALALSNARLFQNVPNPFNQTTQINYYLPQNTGAALIQITGINGETMKTIALSGSGAGQVSVQTTQLAAGTYTYSLIVDGNLIDTKKMVLVK